MLPGLVVPSIAERVAEVLLFNWRLPRARHTCVAEKLSSYPLA
jgi:hypothetical protein